MTLRSAGLMALLVFGTSASAQVNTTAPVADESGVATVDQESFSGGVSLNGTYFDVRHQTNSGVGYKNGFTQFGAFAPIWGSPDWFIAPNARMTLTDDAATGLSAGLVARRYSESLDRIFGVNAYYDDDQSINKNRYRQIGFGAETLGNIVDVRANAYLPTSNDTNFIRTTGLSPNLVFFGNRLGFSGTQLVEQSLSGGDAEIGVPLAPNLPWLRGYAGAYAYRQNSGSTTTGFRGRVEGWVTNDLSLGAMVTTDSLFGTNVNFMADWRFAGFQPTRYFPNWSTRDRMLMPVNRQWRVSVAETQEQFNVAANNPHKVTAGAADARYFVVWVDPNRGTANPGTGTYEDPFHQTLPATVPGQTDLVMVLRGDSATAAGPLRGPIALPDFARMLGEGRGHIVDVAATTFGAFTQPARNDALVPDLRFRDTGPFAGLYPILTSVPGQNIVNVGNHNEVAAFVMQGTATGGSAIAGTNTSGFNFHHLEIRGNNGGIVLTGAQGSGLPTLDGQSILGGRIADINRNTVVGWANPGGLGDNGTLGGIRIATGVAALGLNLERISMNATPGAGLQDYGIRLLTGQGRLVVDMQDISTSGGNAIAGVSLEQNTGELNATIGTTNPLLPSLTSSFNTGVGLQLISGNLRPMTVVGTNVFANSNALDNLQIAGAGNSIFNATFSNSTFDNSTAGSGVSLTMSSGIKTLSLTNVSSASNNFLSGVALASGGGSLVFTADTLTANDNGLDNLRIGTQLAPLVGTTFVGTITDSFFNQTPLLPVTTGSGIVLSQSGGTGTLNLLRVQTNNNANGPGLGGDGMGLFGSAATVMNVHNTNGQSNFNSRDAFHVEAVGGSTINLIVDPTSGSNNDRDGLFFNLAGNSRLNVTFQDDTLNNNGRNAVHGELDSSRVDLVFNNTKGNNSGESGFFLNARTNSTPLINSVANLTFTNGASPAGLTSFVDSGQTAAGSSGVELNAAAGSSVNLTMTGTPLGNTPLVGGTADYGLTVRSQDAGTNVMVTATGVSFNNVGVNAVRTILDGGQATFEFTNTTGTNAGDGLNVMVNAGGIFNACLINSHFDGSSGAGLRITTNGMGAVSNIHMEDSSADRNRLGGLVAEATAGGVLNLRTVRTTFDGNGTDTGLSDGVFVRADGLNSQAHLLFNNTTAKNNRGDQSVGVHRGNGFNFEANNGASMTASIDTITATGNDGYGVRLDAQDTLNLGTNAILLPAGTNNVIPNGLGSYSINYSGTNLAIVALSGSFNNNLVTDGVQVSINNVGTAVVSLTGNGTMDTINGNNGHGVNIQIANVNSAGVRIAGYTQISGNALDGVHLVMNNVATSAAVEILGPTALTNNGGDGVDLAMTNVVLGTFTAPPGLDSLVVIKLVNDPPNAASCIPVPANVLFSSLVKVPSATTNGILVDGLNVSRTAAAPVGGPDGISITGSHVTGAGLVTLTNNTIRNYNNGIHAAFDAVGGASSFGGLTINTAIIDNSTASGIAVSMNASGAPILISGSTINNSGADGIRLNLDGATGGFNVTKSNNIISNSRANGINLTAVGAVLGTISDPSTVTNSRADGVHIDLTNATIAGLLVDQFTISNSGLGGAGDGLEIILNGTTASGPITVSNTTTTDSAGRGVFIHGIGGGGFNNLSLGAINLSNVTATRSTVSEGVLVDFNAAAVANGTVGSITLNNVSALNSSLDGLHVDLSRIAVGGPITLDGRVGGAGSAVARSNNNGLSGAGTGDGIEVNLNAITGTPNVSILNYASVNANSNRGIALLTNGSPLLLPNGSPVGAVVVSGNTVSNSNGGDGVLLNLTNSVVGSVTAANDVISTSAGRGLDIVLDGVTGLPNITVSNTIGTTTSATTANGRGVSIDGSGSAANPMLLGNVLLSNVTATGSGGVTGDGVVVDLRATVGDGSAVGAITLNNVSALNSNLDGIRVNLNTLAVGGAITLDGSVAGVATAVSNNNGLSGAGTGDGIEVNLNAITGTPNVSILNYALVNTNTNRGIALLTNGSPLLLPNGSPVGAVVVSGNTVSNSTGGQGVLLDLRNSRVGSVTADSDVISTSAGRGLDIVLNGVRGLLPAAPAPTITVSNTTSTTTTNGRGVSIDGSGSGVNPMVLGNVLLSNVTATGSGGVTGDGVVVDLRATVGDGSTVGSITLNNVSALNNRLDGIRVNLNTIAVGGPILLDGRVAGAGAAVARSNNNGLSGAGTGDGIEVNLNAITGTPNVSILNYASVNANSNRGIALLTNPTPAPLGSPVGAVTVSGNTVSNSTGGQGVLLNLTNSAVSGAITASNDTISNSFGRGLDVILNGVTGAQNVTLSNDTVTTSGGRGVSVAGIGATLGNVTLTTVSSGLPLAVGSGTTAEEGVAVDLSAGTVGSVLLDNVSAVQSFGRGILVQLANENVGPSIVLNGQGTAVSTNNGGDGILVNLTPPLGGIPDVTIENYQSVDTNAGRGIALQTNGSRVGAVNVSGNIVSNSTGITTGQGIQLDLTNSQVGSVLVDSNTISNSFSRGLDVILSGVNGGLNPAPVIAISNDTVTSSGGRGVSVAGSGGTTVLGDILLTNVSSTTTTANEGVVVAFNTNATVGSILLNNVSASLSKTTGILIDLNAVTMTGATPVITLNGQGTGQVTGNGTGVGGAGDGIWIKLDTLTGTPNVSVSDYGGLGQPGLIGTNAGDGVIIHQVNLADVGTVNIDFNTITANTTNGVLFLTNNSREGQVTLTENQITGHTGGDGVLVGPLGDTDNTLNFNFLRNTITGNTGGRGVDFNLQYAVANANVLNANFTNDTISTNGQEGISILMTQAVRANVTINSDAVTPNPVSLNTHSDISGNGSFGLLINTHNTASYGLTVGGTGSQNTFNGNTDAGIGLLMNNSGVQGAVFSTFNISNVAVTNTIDGPNLNFNGDGIRLVMQDPASNTGTAVVRNATLGAAALNNTLLGDNAGAGFALDAMQSTIIGGFIGVIPTPLTIRNSTFQNTAAGPAQLNGIEIIRRNGSKLTGTTIVGNTITGHTQNGIRLDLAGGNIDIETALPGLVTDFTIGGAALAARNTITGNTGGDVGAGINILASADVIGRANIQNNIISNNTSNGILAQVDFFGTLNGTWNQNTINSNTRDGIQMIGARSATANVLIDQNTINLSGRDGIHVATSSTGAVPTVFNLGITRNTIDSSTRDGINLAATVASTISVANLDNNLIRLNGQDGLDLSTSGAANVNLTTLNNNTVTGLGATVGTGNGLLAVATNGVGGTGISITSNTTSFANFGNAGVNLQASNQASLNAAFTDLNSRFNGGRGVSLLNTGSAQMAVNITGSNDTRATGGVGALSRIEENGLNGVYVENNAGAVNTSNAITLTLANTSIRGNGITSSAVTDDNRNGIWMRVGTSSAGRVNATLQRNILSGNANIDFVTESFTATPDPAVVSQYTNPAGHVVDPLARLGLVFTNNIGDQIDTTRFGANYSNADGFKSPQAIFNATNRLRNAQRFNSGGDIVARNDNVSIIAPRPATSTTVFSGNTLGGIGPNNVLTGLGVDINANPRSDITAFNNGTGALTVNPALGAAPVAGDPFSVVANQISGTGTSTFRVSNPSTVLNGNAFVGTQNQFTTVVSNFTTSFVNLIDGPGGNQDDNPSAGIFGGTSLDYRWNSVAAPFYP